MERNRTFAFIFARGGSKGLPNKNILPIAGQPMLAHGIRIARQLEEVSAVFVSTDCPEIAEVGKAYGAEIIDRPSELSGDTSPEWLAWQHAVNIVQRKYGPFDRFLSLPPTAPCRRLQDVRNCLDALTQEVDLVLTMSPSHRSPWFNMVVSCEDGLVRLANKSSRIQRRQDAPACFDLATVAYVAHPTYILASAGIWDGKVYGVQVPTEHAIDVDTHLDYAVAKFFLEDYFLRIKDNHHA
jgi:CMP-N-acetylneuraminic acid synthetase